MLDDATVNSFDTIYNTDLVYTKNCWEMCGDAHCCGFFRYKEKFKLMARRQVHEIPLLPGEYAYLQRKGWWDHFGDVDHKVVEYALDDRVIKIESIISRRPDCACDHDTRLTVCRLYPLLPVFDLDGRILGIDNFGIFEELEKIDGLEAACKLTGLSFQQLQKFLIITSEIARIPLNLFYLASYRLTLKHVRSQVLAAKNSHPADSFSVFERLILRDKLINHSELKTQLVSLADQFQQHYGSRFNKVHLQHP